MVLLYKPVSTDIRSFSHYYSLLKTYLNANNDAVKLTSVQNKGALEIIESEIMQRFTVFACIKSAK